MQLIQELSSGLSAAANGTADVYSRATSTPVGYFTDAEGNAPVSSGTTIILDAQGAAEIYVNQVVALIVRNAGGDVVSDTTVMDAAPLLEVRSLSFVGQDYVSGASAPGNPTTAQAVFDKVSASFGTTDWQVAVRGTNYNMTAALGGVIDLYFNVRDPTYGALGDGTTDDTAAITAAITAATIAGGTVYFPPADANDYYRITSVITVPKNVNLLGAGPQSSVIGMDNATATMFTTSVSSPTGEQPRQIFSNLSIRPAVSNTGSVLEVKNTMPILIDNCLMGSVLSVGTSEYIIKTTVAGCDVLATNGSVFSNGNDNPIFSSSADVTMQFTNCRVVGLAAARTGTLFEPRGIFKATSCAFDTSASVAGVYTSLDLNTNGADGTLTGCTFVGNVAAPGFAFSTPDIGGGTDITESGSTFQNMVPFIVSSDVSGFPLIITNSALGTRAESFNSSGGSGTAVFMSNSYGAFYVDTDAGTTLTMTAAEVYPGAKLSLTVRNSHLSNALTMAFSVSNFHGEIPGDGGSTIPVLTTRSWNFVMVATSTSDLRWVCTGTSFD